MGLTYETVKVEGRIIGIVIVEKCSEHFSKLYLLNCHFTDKKCNYKPIARPFNDSMSFFYSRKVLNTKMYHFF